MHPPSIVTLTTLSLLLLGCSDGSTNMAFPSSTGGVNGEPGVGVPLTDDPSGNATGGTANGIGSGGTAASVGSGGAGTDGGNTGGATSTGGSTGTGGTVSTCTEPDGEVCDSYRVGDHCGLTFEIWTDSASACMTNTTTGFLATWDSDDGNYLARKGVRPGSAAPIVTYSANYQPNGNSYLGVYGWTTDPLIEYYIIDSWGSWRPPGTDVIGTVAADGGTYQIYRSERVDKPSIQGNTTFWQYWSVRTEKRTSGTITVRPHFEAWAAFGLTLGDFYEVSMLVEGYHSSGTADVTVSFQ